MSFQELFKEELIELDIQSHDKIDFFERISSELVEKGYVENSFREAIIARENIYPTGLQLDGFAVAIPHTDVVHIKKPFVAIKRLVEDIDFYQMGTDDVVVPVKDILILGIKEPKNQVGLLSDLMSCFADSEFVRKYRSVNTKESIIDLINNSI
ncbi:PTS system IIA component (Gat family) [Trichococcus patagoniensis]|uniref:PTS system IIA component (Gat family) n=1 Tax=Trichococcus patagoniensis TaxID=382641 RepID=A0A2T5IK40_9LACT|nr:PTS sugar transporter subunit IIA [Trichococcus patagoniensis]PTQ84188.1 PTS system IIA component (Gat family) [Trichococcus patagoniensis]